MPYVYQQHSSDHFYPFISPHLISSFALLLQTEYSPTAIEEIPTVFAPSR